MDYLLFLLILIPCLILSAWASARVNSTFSAFDKVQNRSRMTGYDTAVRLLANRNVQKIQVLRVNGKLTDHYNPAKQTVNLSAATYGSASVAAVAVAAHECGHVMQREENYVPYRIRHALVPIANIGSRLALPLIVIGIILDVLLVTTPFPFGQWMVYLGIALYAASTLFMLVTLPVEFNASRRAKKMLVSDGILSEDELDGASKVLSAAALTYVAAMLISLVYFLRFFLIAMSFLRRRN